MVKATAVHGTDSAGGCLLIINAKDDPVLVGDCFPCEQVKDNPYIFLETPGSGGHCGFVMLRGEFRHINRGISFIENKNW